jgi:hypothetical protein
MIVFHADKSKLSHRFCFSMSDCPHDGVADGWPADFYLGFAPSKQKCAILFFTFSIGIGSYPSSLQHLGNFDFFDFAVWLCHVAGLRIFTDYIRCDRVLVMHFFSMWDKFLVPHLVVDLFRETCAVRFRYSRKIRQEQDSSQFFNARVKYLARALRNTVSFSV